MAKKKSATKTKKATSRSVAKHSSTIHGLEHDFILIVGGGFVLLVLVMVVLYY